MSEGIIHTPDIYAHVVQVGLEFIPLAPQRTDDIVQDEAIINPNLVQGNVLSDPKKMEVEFRDCVNSGKDHIEFSSSRYLDACSKSLHLNLLDAISETEY